MKAEDQFHVGIVVENLDAATAELTDLFGYQWTAELGGPTPVSLVTGDVVVSFRCVYSTTSPRLEIVGRIPGTLWEPVAGSGIHHVGYWSDDVAADSVELQREHYEVEATRDAPDGVPLFAFLRSPVGFRVELVSRRAQPSLEQCWSAVTDDAI